MQTLRAPSASVDAPPAVSTKKTRTWRHRHLGFAPSVDLTVVVLILAYLAILLPGLARFPPLNNDEGREANLSWAATGLEAGAERMNTYRGFATWGTGGLQGATTVALFRMFGLGVFQARLTSLLWGGLLLLAVYGLGRRYWGAAVGAMAVVLLGVSDPFLLSSHTLRPDIQIITLVLTALTLVEYGFDRGRAWPFLLAGIVLGLSVDTHLNTLCLMPFVAAAPIVRLGWRVWRRPAVWLIGAGFGLALLYYLVVRVLPDPAGYLAAGRYWVGVDKTPPLVRQAGGGLLNQVELEALRYADYFGLSPQGMEEPAELGLILVGLGMAAWRALRGSRPDRTLLLGLLVAMVLFVVAVSMKSRYYMLLTYPIYALLIARAFMEIAQRARRWVPPGAALVALVIVAVLWPLKFQDRAWDKYVRGVRYRAGQEYYALTAQLELLAGPDAKILAPPLYWFGLHSHRFVDVFVFERVKRQYGIGPAQFLEEVRPDVVITDAKIATERANEHDLYRALDELAPHEQIVRHKNYGDVAIYRLTW